LRIRAYRTAARTIRDLGSTLAHLPATKLQALDGIFDRESHPHAGSDVAFYLR
jgi:hypothetical protein